jgi:hypothetical protein
MGNEIQLTEKQFNLIVENNQQINYLREKLTEAENKQNQILQLICDFNDFDMAKQIELDIEKKILKYK